MAITLSMSWVHDKSPFFTRYFDSHVSYSSLPKLPFIPSPPEHPQEQLGMVALESGVLGFMWPFGVYRLASLLSWPTAASRTLDLGVRLPCRPCLSGWKDPTKPVELSAEPRTADQGEDSIPDPNLNPVILSRLPLRYDSSSMSFEFCWRKNSINSPSSAL